MGSLHGYVKSAELCAPITGVVVAAYSAGDELNRVRTDESGFWDLPTDERTEEVRFFCNGYVAKSFPVGAVPTLVRLIDEEIIGYCDRLWCFPGEELPVRVHATRSYHARLFRHGIEKVEIRDLGKHPEGAQKVPDRTFVDTGLAWEESFRMQVPAEARPGLYSVLLESDGQEPFAIPLVVSTPPGDRGKRASLLLLGSTTTWQSYNLWGGRSRYRNFELENATPDYIKVPQSWWQVAKTKVKDVLPDVAVQTAYRVAGVKVAGPPDWMYARLSINRPFTNCRLEEDTAFAPFTNHLAAGEWRLIAWLEREGIDYDMASGFELETDDSLLDPYQGLVLSTHCEYWSSNMFRHLENAHTKNGLWIVNLSGNAIYREIEFEDDGSTRCVSLSFADSCADETQLIGVRFSEIDYSTCAPFRILRPDHRIFSGISLPEDRCFGGMSLNQNTVRRGSRYDPGRPGVENALRGMGSSGWETDKLSATAPDDMVVVARGQNPKGGAEMIFRDPSGTRGGMFSASSLCFSSSLLIDSVASSIVRNVFREVEGGESNQEMNHHG